MPQHAQIHHHKSPIPARKTEIIMVHKKNSNRLHVAFVFYIIFYTKLHFFHFIK